MVVYFRQHGSVLGPEKEAVCDEAIAFFTKLQLRKYPERPSAYNVYKGRWPGRRFLVPALIWRDCNITMEQKSKVANASTSTCKEDGQR